MRKCVYTPSDVHLIDCQIFDKIKYERVLQVFLEMDYPIKQMISGMRFNRTADCIILDLYRSIKIFSLLN